MGPTPRHIGKNPNTIHSLNQFSSVCIYQLSPRVLSKPSGSGIPSGPRCKTRPFFCLSPKPCGPRARSSLYGSRSQRNARSIRQGTMRIGTKRTKQKSAGQKCAAAYKLPMVWRDMRNWWAMQVSNLRPPQCECGALPLS